MVKYTGITVYNCELLHLHKSSRSAAASAVELDWTGGDGGGGLGSCRRNAAAAGPHAVCPINRARVCVSTWDSGDSDISGPPQRRSRCRQTVSVPQAHDIAHRCAAQSVGLVDIVFDIHTSSHTCCRRCCRCCSCCLGARPLCAVCLAGLLVCARVAAEMRFRVESIWQGATAAL